jgi:hypothetical protein
MRYPPRVTQITATYSEGTSGEFDAYECDASTPFTLTLKSPATRRRVSVFNSGASGNLTVATAGTSATIDGATSLSLQPGQGVTLVANGLTGSSAAWRSQSSRSGKMYTNPAAATAISNTTTETAFSTAFSIPANSLKVGSLIKIRYQGIATATNGSDTLAVKLYLATDTTAGAIVGTALISHAATDVSNSDVFTGEYELIVRTVGASGTVVGVGTYKSIPAAEGTMTVKDDILASTALDTTVSQIVAVSATWSAASSSDSVRLDFLRVEVL